MMILALFLSLCLCSSFVFQPVFASDWISPEYWQFPAYAYWYAQGFTNLSFTETQTARAYLDIGDLRFSYTDYSKTFRFSESTSGSYSGTISSGSGVSVGIDSGSITGTTTISSSVQFAVQPISNGGSWSVADFPMSYDKFRKLRECYIVWIGPGVNGTQSVVVTSGSGNPKLDWSFNNFGKFQYVNGSTGNIGSLYLYRVRVYDDSGSSYYRARISFNGVQDHYMVMPIFLGTFTQMPDDLKRLITEMTISEQLLLNLSSGADKTNDLLENGNSKSKSAESSANSAKSNLDKVNSQSDKLDKQAQTGLNDALSGIDTSNPALTNNKFLSSANWIRVQFDHLILNTPFADMLTYALVMGISLTMIGKLRNR